MAAPKYVGTRIYYTADVYIPDEPCDNVVEDGPYQNPEARAFSCTCTNSYGEPTEHGHGETVESGWLEPGWSASVVYEDREDVEPDYPFGTVWDIDEEAVAAAIVAEALAEAPSYHWHKHFRPNYIADYISDRIGIIDHFDGETAYAADSIEDYRTGVRARLAAHVYEPE